MGIIIAIDGPAAAGKGTLGRGLALDLGLALLDTGKLYRAVAFAVMERGIDPSDVPACSAVAEELEPGWLDRGGLGGETVGQVASKVSAIPGVRAALFDFQRRFATEPRPGTHGAILDGRDIGTVVCPDATLKIFLIADLESRAKRRYAEAVEGGGHADLAEITASIRARDEREATRAAAPMRVADDAVVIDTSCLTPSEVLEQAVGALASRLGSTHGPAVAARTR
jgi:cytidylate kinase